MTHQAELVTQPASTQETLSDQDLKKNKTIALVAYGLYILGFLTMISPLVAVIVNYVKRSDTKGSYLLSHHVWMIRTFWWSILWTVVGVITTFIMVGWIVLIGVFIWYIYRVARGVLRLLDEKPMYEYNL